MFFQVPIWQYQNCNAADILLHLIQDLISFLMKEETMPRAVEGPDRSVGCEPLRLRKIASKQLKTLD